MRLLLCVLLFIAVSARAQSGDVFIKNEFEISKTYYQTAEWYDGSKMDDGKADGIIYKELNGQYYVLSDYKEGTALNAKLFGVKADGLVDDTSSMQKALNLSSKYAFTLFLPAGVINITSGLYLNTVNTLNRKVRVVGSGISNTIIRSISNTGETALTVIGEYYDNFEMKDLRIERLDVGVASGGIGLKVERLVYSSLENIDIFRFDTGLVLSDVSTFYMKNVNTRWGNRGMVFRMEPGGMSNPNLIEMHSCVLNSNAGWGLTVINGHSVNIYSSLFEDNKLGGINFLYNGSNGANSINLQGSYFEGNGGADFYLKSIAPGSHNLSGNTFNRVSNRRFTTSNIVFDFQAGGNHRNVVNMIGNGFFTAGNYEVSKSRPAVAIFGESSFLKITDTNLYLNEIEKPKYISDDY